MEHLALSSIISHGFMDFFAMGSKTNTLLLYVTNIYVYNFFLNFNKEVGIMIFYLLSCYHFGKDFQIITKDRSGVSNWMGPFVLGMTLDCIDGMKVWLSVFHMIGFPTESFFIFIDTIFIIKTLSFIGIVFSRNYNMLFFAVTSTILNTYLTLFQSMMVYMTTIHVPLALCQFYDKYGLAPLKLWFASTIIMASVNWEILINEKMFLLMVSMTMSHMILISLWQH